MPLAKFIDLFEKADPEKREWFYHVVKALEPSEVIEENLSKTFAPTPWIKLPLPPAPKGDYDFPVSPTYQIVGREQLPDITFPSKVRGMEIVHSNRTLTIEGRWERIVEGIATPNAPFKQTQSTTTGSSKTTSYELGYSITASVNILFASVESTISANFGQSFTFSEEKTVSQEFTFQSPKGIVTLCWWQGDFNCTYRYNATLKSNDVSPPYSSSEMAELVSVIAGVGQFHGKQQTEKFSNRGKTFMSTQYPAVPKKSSLEYDRFDIKE